uniref:Uncharacterized protein n=1 Tax=Oryza glumipatula TaxID=40148 RepID=A0A0E0BNM0_9ORYZ
MGVFCRSIAAANAFPYTLQCIFGCIYGNGTTSRLKQLGMEFTVWVFKHAANDQLKLIGPVILSGILRSLDGSSTTEADSSSRDIKIFAYQAIGLLATRMPNLFSNKTDMAIQLFTALRLEEQSLRLTIQEAATALATAYKGASVVILKDLEALLLENSQMEQSEVRFSAAIGECNTHKVGDNVASKYQSISGSNDGLVFADFCFHTVLYQTPPQGVGCPAGLSVAQSDRVTGKQPLKGDTLTSRKLGILNVIEAMQLAPEIVYPLYLAAASDSQESVTKRGEELLKRKASAVNLEDSNLMKKLFTLFNVEKRKGAQEALTHLLGDQNDLTQDLASQGMSIVYELGDASMKEQLVHALVNTLSGAAKKKRAIKLMEDSEVFQEGTIGNNPTGGKLSTYKELCSLANEMGQPDLIYKFMDLANYQAAINSKRGAAFGFSKIAKQAGEALQPHLHTLIPRLVRYQYDPDKNIQDSMAHIWKLIVADPKKTIDEHYDLIVEDLLVQSGSRLWRSREASCLALADIIQGRRYGQVSKHLRKIWITTFRAMDDIKETVRNAGDSLCRVVSLLTVRLCDVSLTTSSDANETMNIVLPYLLSEGILSKVSSVQKASISLVMKLAKGAGPALKPHLSELVSCMLECLSSLEDQRLNYVEMHAGNAGIQTEKLESLRIAVAKDSPMWETLDICLKVVDKESLDLLVPRLAQMVKSAVGLNTRVGVASFITLLVQKVMVEIKPYAATLLRLLYSAVLEEKSSAAKRAFASTCAAVLKYASPSQAQKLIEDTTSLHLGEKNAQLSAAILIKSYLSNAADILSGYNAVVLPVIFASRFDDDKDIGALYGELWEDIPSSERVTLQLYLPEILSLLCDSMSSSSWAGKRKSAKAIKKLCDALGESLSVHHNNILESLLKELPGRFWEGKDAILDALAALCLSCHTAMSAEDSGMPSVILNAVCAACSRKSKLYREAAFSCLQQVITAFKDPGFFNIVFPMLYEVSNRSVICKTRNSSSLTASSSAEQDETEGVSVSLDKVLNCVASSITVAFLQDIINQRKNILEIILNSLSPEESWQIKLSSFLCIKELCYKFQNSDGNNTWPEETTYLVEELFHSTAPKVVDVIRLVKIAQVHTAASECLLELSKLYRDFPLVDRKGPKFSGELAELCESEKSEQAKAFLKQCMDILKDFEDPTGLAMEMD